MQDNDTTNGIANGKTVSIRFLGASCLLGLALGGAGVALFWTPHDPYLVHVANRLAAPSGHHLLGTDFLGRDMVSVLMRGTAHSLGIAGLAVALGAGGGITLGLYTAWTQPAWPSRWARFLADILFAFPVLVMALLLSLILQSGFLTASLAIGLFFVPVFARISRAAASSVLAYPFIDAALLAGKSSHFVLWRHVLPNIGGFMVVQAFTQASLAILAEAGLSFLGLSLPPPHPSLGRLLFESQSYFPVEPRLALYPGLTIGVTAFVLNYFGEALRERVTQSGYTKA